MFFFRKITRTIPILRQKMQHKKTPLYFFTIWLFCCHWN